MINKVASTTAVLMFILLGLLGLGFWGRAFENSITSYAFWLYIVIGTLLLFITWALYKMISDFERLTNRYLDALQEMGYQDLDDYTKKKRLHQTIDEILDAEKEVDDGSLLEAMSTDDLLALRKKYKNNPSVVKLIESVLEARSKGTEEV